MTAIALDTNLLLLLVVGSAVGDVVGKRLKSYTREDWVILQKYLEQSDQLIATPNVWTEVSNICTFAIVSRAAEIDEHGPVRDAPALFVSPRWEMLT